MKILKKLLSIFMVVVITGMFSMHVSAASMADLATSISTFEVLKDVTIAGHGTNYYSVDITEEGKLTLTTTRINGDYISINVYNENGECVYSNPYPDDFYNKDIQEIPLNRGTYIISIYERFGESYDLTTSFNKSTAPEIIMTANLKIGKSLQLGAVLTKGTEKITWTTNKASVAKISSNGLVTGKNIGSAIITATSKSGLKTKIDIIVTK